MSSMSTSPSYIAASPLADCLTDLLLDHQNETATARLCCPADFPGFAGHFPGQPVLPAVLQLLAVRLLAETLRETKLTPVGVERLKFKGMVGPNEVVELRVRLNDQAGLLKGEFRLARGSAPIASGTLLFRQRDREQ